MRQALAIGIAMALISSAPFTPASARKKPKPPIIIDLPAQPLKPVTAAYPIGVDPAMMPRMLPETVLPTNSEVVVRLTTDLSSRTVRTGDTFTAMTAQDVLLADMVVIPRGTRVNGLVTWRTGKGAFGKSAKMEYAITSLDFDGQSIPLDGRFRQEGSGNGSMVIAGVAAVGPLAAVITGKSAVVPAGTELKAYTRMPLPVLSPSAFAKTGGDVLVDIRDDIAPSTVVGALNAGLLCRPQGRVRWGQIARPNQPELAEHAQDIVFAEATGMSTASNRDTPAVRRGAVAKYRSIAIIIKFARVNLCVAGLGIGERKPRGRVEVFATVATRGTVPSALTNRDISSIIALDGRDPRRDSSVYADMVLDIARQFADSSPN